MTSNYNILYIELSPDTNIDQLKSKWEIGTLVKPTHFLGNYRSIDQIKFILFKNS